MTIEHKGKFSLEGAKEYKKWELQEYFGDLYKQERTETGLWLKQVSRKNKGLIFEDENKNEVHLNT